MQEKIFLRSPAAERLYASVRSLPIIDYHCHLLPEAILRDEPFRDIGELWLAGDHYKWRLMREAGVDEHFITGPASWEEKFVCYAACVELAVGSPLYHWTMLELDAFFGIREPLTAENALEIYRKANEIIKNERLSPRKCIEMSRVEYVCTTDDPADDLATHRALQSAGLRFEVAPAFRADRIADCRKPYYADYIARLGAAAGVTISNISELKTAISRRLDEFCELGCRFADVGVEGFPSAACSDENAERIFAAALRDEAPTAGDYADWLGWLYRFLGREYARRGMISQLHFAAKRNSRTALFESFGADAGGDTAGDAISPSALADFLDSCERADALPETIVYTLETSNAAALFTAALTFPRVRMGAAWWYNDTLAGIARQLELTAETGYIAAFPGMLTDSRSFLSYPRHDYFRRIAASLLGEWVERGEATEAACLKVIEHICYKNAAKMTK